MPAYAVQWAAMRAAARRRCAEYDLWGILPDEELDHPWRGLWHLSRIGRRLMAYAETCSAPRDLACARTGDAAERRPGGCGVTLADKSSGEPA